jgi:hypothetical protein
LEHSVEVDDEKVASQHRTVARWLKHFLTQTKETLVESSKAKPPTEDTGENPYVETSSNVDEL